MANPQRGEVALGEYTLKMSANAICEVEDALDMPIAQIAAALEKPENFRMKFARAIVWAGLQERHEGLTLREAGDIVQSVGIGEAMQAVGKAFSLAFPQAEADAKPNPRKAAAA